MSVLVFGKGLSVAAVYISPETPGKALCVLREAMTVAGVRILGKDVVKKIGVMFLFLAIPDSHCLFNFAIFFFVLWTLYGAVRCSDGRKYLSACS